MFQKFIIFVLRWVLNSLGLWVAVRLLSDWQGTYSTLGIVGFLSAGLVFSLVNTLLRPLIVILSLPAILFSLGLFMIIINGILVYISIKLTPGINMTFIDSILTGMILSLVNYIVSTATRSKKV